MKVLKNQELSQYTSFGTGGPADRLYICEGVDEIQEALKVRSEETWLLGYGTNVLVSDEGLVGMTLLMQGGTTDFQDTSVTVDAGVWWDDFVAAAISRDLWGVELMSGIPSSVGAAVFGNIAAYGQQVADVLAWVEIYDKTAGNIHRIQAEDLTFGYRACSLQQKDCVVLRANFRLSHEPTHTLTYTSALTAAAEIGAQTGELAGRRASILHARELAGSLYTPGKGDARTAGSFFKNPFVDLGTAKQVAGFDETGHSLERLLKQNKLHGGDTNRVSAAHVLLAAGFKRGQTWGAVRLHPHHVLKLENTGGATSQDIYDVAEHIMQTVQMRLGIELEPEVRFLGSFNMLK